MSIKPENVMTEMKLIKIKLPVLPADLKTLPEQLTAVINYTFDVSSKKIPQYYPPLEAFKPDYTGKKIPSIPNMANPSNIPKGKFPENSNYKTLWDLKDLILKDNMKELLIQIDAFNGKKTLPIYSPTCITTDKAKDILSKPEEVYCSSYQSSVPELKDIKPTINRKTGNVSNVGCMEPKVKLSCNVPSYFNLFNTLEIINSCVRNILGALTLIDDLIAYNELYMKRIDDAMTQQLDIQAWYEKEKRWVIEAKKPLFNDITGFIGVIEKIETYVTQIDNYFYSYYDCMYSANSYFKNKCHPSYITSCTAILNVIDRISVYIQNITKYIKSIILAKKVVFYAQEAIDILNRPVMELRKYMYVNFMVSPESPYFAKYEGYYLLVREGDGFKQVSPAVNELSYNLYRTVIVEEKGYCTDSAVMGSCGYLRTNGNSTMDGDCECSPCETITRGFHYKWVERCFKKNNDAITAFLNDKNNAQRNIEDNLTMFGGTPLVIPPSVTLGCCSLELYCPKGSCDVTQFCKIKISSNAVVNGEQVPSSTDKNSAAVMLPGQKELNEKSPLCWSLDNAQNPTQCMAGWLLFTDGNCYAPEGVVNPGSPYNKQELASYTNDELYYYFNKFQITQPVNCPAPKLTPVVQNTILTNAQAKFAKQETVSKSFVLKLPPTRSTVTSSQPTVTIGDLKNTYLTDSEIPKTANLINSNFTSNVVERTEQTKTTETGAGQTATTGATTGAGQTGAGQTGAGQTKATTPAVTTPAATTPAATTPATTTPGETKAQESSFFSTTNIIICVVILLVISSSSSIFLFRKKGNKNIETVIENNESNED